MPSDLLWHDGRLLWLLLLVPLVGVVGFSEQRRRAALRFSATHLLALGPKGWRARAAGLLPLLSMAALALAIIALARPQTSGARTRDLSVEGIDIVIAFDISTSMEAGDFRRRQGPHHRGQGGADRLHLRRANDRIGLVVFAGEAYTQAPLTLDYGVLRRS